MNSKKIIFTLVAILLIGSAQLLTAVPAHADNPVLNLDANGNLVILPPTTTPAAPPPPPPAPVTPPATPPPTIPSALPPSPDITGHHPWPPSDNTTPHHPRPPRPPTTWPYGGYYPGYYPGVTWPNQYYSWYGNYPWVGTNTYAVLPAAPAGLLCARYQLVHSQSQLYPAGPNGNPVLECERC